MLSSATTFDTCIDYSGMTTTGFSRGRHRLFPFPEDDSGAESA